MPTDATFRFGKSRVTIEVQGCVACGARWSSGWTVVRKLTIQVGGREGQIALHACADCIRNKTPLLI